MSDTMIVDLGQVNVVGRCPECGGEILEFDNACCCHLMIEGVCNFVLSKDRIDEVTTWKFTANQWKSLLIGGTILLPAEVVRSRAGKSNDQLCVLLDIHTNWALHFFDVQPLSPEERSQYVIHDFVNNSRQ